MLVRLTLLLARSFARLAAYCSTPIFIWYALTTETTKKAKYPLERAVDNQRFEVLRRRVSERADASSPRVTPAPQIVDFQRAFERNRVAHFLWFLSFGKTKERNSPSGEIFAKRSHSYSENKKLKKNLPPARQRTCISEKTLRAHSKRVRRSAQRPPTP